MGFGNKNGHGFYAPCFSAEKSGSRFEKAGPPAKSLPVCLILHNIA